MAHHHHNHTHTHPPSKDGTTGRLWISIILNLIITLAEIVGGIISNSLALLSDALHNFSDTASLGISLMARRISVKDANADKTFGYRRAEIIGAFINLITLVLISLFLLKEGVERFIEPEPIDGMVMFIVATIGLLGNVITAMLLHSKSKDNINIRSAYVHIFTDALSSVGVIIGGILVVMYQLYWIDALLTVAIGLYILAHTYHLLKSTIDILMESTPEEIELDEVICAMSEVQYVQDIHHVHVWRLDEQQICLESHVAIKQEHLPCMESIKNRLKEVLSEHFGIHHSTLEFEFERCGKQSSADCHEFSSAEKKGRMQQNNTLETIATNCNTISSFLARRDLSSLTRQTFGEASGQAKADLIILLGNAVLETLNVTAKAYKRGLARNLMIAGGLGHSTSYLAEAVKRDNRPSSVLVDDRAEAEILGDLLADWYGVDRREIFLEKESTNCGDNALKSLRQTEKYELNPQHIILIQDPTMQLRSHASFQKVWMQKTNVTFYSYAAFVPEVVVHNGQLALNSFSGRAAWSIERFISLLLGEIPRLRNDRNGYGPAGKNFIVHIDIPEEVYTAYKKLRHWVEANRPSVAKRLI